MKYIFRFVWYVGFGLMGLILFPTLLAFYRWILYPLWNFGFIRRIELPTKLQADRLSFSDGLDWWKECWSRAIGTFEEVE